MARKKTFFTIISIILIVLMIFSPIISYASGIDLGDLNDYKGSETGAKEITTRVSNILGYVQIIGTVLSVVILVIIGIRYMITSVEERAEYKKTMWLYLLGAFLIFSGTLLPQIIYNFMKDV